MKKQQITGAIHKARGKVKKVTGRIVGNDEMACEGKIEYARGTAQEAYGVLKSDVRKGAR